MNKLEAFFVGFIIGSVLMTMFLTVGKESPYIPTEPDDPAPEYRHE